MTLTLSAPASNTCSASSALRMPPPTAKGTKSSRAARRTVSSSVWRPSCVAVMSSRTISSAPSRAWRAASAAGSPASTRSTNCTPFTTRPPWTSRHAMMRLVSIVSPWLPLKEIAQNLQPRLSGFFRMELHAHHIVPLHRGRKRLDVLGNGGSVSGDWSLIGMCEVDDTRPRSTPASRRDPSRTSSEFQPTCGTFSEHSGKRVQRSAKCARPG